MGSQCAMHRPWESVQCVCGHGAGMHGSNVTGTGCMALRKRTVTVEPIEPLGHPNRGMTVTRELHDGCGCEIDREDVLYAALQRAIAEVCEHNEQKRTRRADLK